MYVAQGVLSELCVDVHHDLRSQRHVYSTHNKLEPIIGKSTRAWYVWHTWLRTVTRAFWSFVLCTHAAHWWLCFGGMHQLEAKIHPSLSFATLGFQTKLDFGDEQLACLL
jgi:hypothetical protein